MSGAASRPLPRPQVPTCVLGMHRSGTSLVAGLVRLLGVDLGPEAHLLPPNYGNPKGFWEHKQFVQLNDQVLATLGGTWHELPTFAPGWENSPELAAIRRQARVLIEQEFASSTCWGWKDPRTCLTAPLWKQLLPEIRFVVCLRNPMDVAHSLQARDGFSVEKAIQLWLSYMTAAVEHSTGQRRLFVVYEDCLEQPQIQVERLARFLGQTEYAAQADTQAAVQHFIETALHHYRSPVLEVRPQTRATVLARAFYLSLQIYAKLEEQPGWAVSAEATQLQHTLRHFGHYCLHAQRDLDQACQNAEQDAEQVTVLSQDIARLSQELASQKEAVQHTHSLLTETQNQLSLGVEEAQTLQADLTAKQHELAQLQHQLVAIESAHSQQTQTLHQLQHQLAETQAVRTQQEHELLQLQDQLQRQESLHQETQITAQTQIAQAEQRLSVFQLKATQAATELNTFRQRRVIRVLSRVRPSPDLSPQLAPTFQQLRDDSLLFTSDLHGFRLQPSVNLASAPFVAYSLSLQRPQLSGVLFAVIVDLPLTHGEFGIEIISPANTIVVQHSIPCSDINTDTPTPLTFPALPDSDQSGFGLRVFVRAVTTPIRIFEWQKYTWGGLGYLQTRAFCGFLFD